MKVILEVRCEHEFTKEEIKNGWEERLEDFKYHLRQVIEDECGIEYVKINIKIEEN